MRKFVVPGVAALMLTGCNGGGAQQSDLECYAASMAAARARPNSPDLIVMVGYYMGRLDGADPDGRWTQTIAAKVDEVQSKPQEFEALFEGCAKTLRDSTGRQQSLLIRGPGASAN